jgi:hypothetical protein
MTTSADLKGHTDDELAEIMATATDTEAAAIVAEFDRRDRAAKRHAKDAARWAATYAAWHDAAHAQYIAAEAATNGYMLSREGDAAGIDPFDLWSGTEARLHRMASEELRNYLDANPRLTISEYHRQDRASRRAAREAYEGE